MEGRSRSKQVTNRLPPQALLQTAQQAQQPSAAVVAVGTSLCPQAVFGVPLLG